MDQKQPCLTAKMDLQSNHSAAKSANSFLVLTAAEAAAIFHKAPRTWRTWDLAGRIPRPIRIGRTTYWRPEELQAWVAAGCPDREVWEQQKS